MFGLLKHNNKSSKKGLLGIETGPEGIALAWVARDPGAAPSLRHCEFRACAPAAQLDTLRKMVSSAGLEGLPVNLVLHPATYQLLLMESPEVEPAELRDAMRWRLREMISEPIDEQIMDCFALPADAYRGRSRMAYCATFAKTAMLQFRHLINHAGLNLQFIDITEMALRNVGLLAGADGINLGLLRLRTSEGLICVQNGAELYMARRIEQGLAPVGDDLAGMILEVQRSLDYFESQLGKGYISRLLLLPMKREGDRAREALRANLAVNLQALELRDLFPGQAAAELDESEQAYCLAAVGAALRQEAD